MYQSSKDSPGADVSEGDSKPKDDKKIEDADFEVVEEDQIFYLDINCQFLMQ